MSKSLIFLMALLVLAASPVLASSVQACAILTGGSAGGLTVSGTYSGNLGGQDNQGCNVLITFNADGSITTTNPNSAPSYDSGGDDNLVGIINNTGHAISSLFLSNPSVNIFGFESDGVCGGPGFTFDPSGPNCGAPTDPSGYAPQGVTFAPVDAFSGTVNFAPGIAANGGTAFFSLEGPVSKSLTVGPSVPEPASVFLFGSALLATVLVVRKKQRT